MAAFEFHNAQQPGQIFKHHGVRYLFFGKSGAILLGYSDTTQDVDLYVDKHLVFVPDGIERFDDAWSRRIERHGFPIASLDDIIVSKQVANRQKDRESLPRLLSFREWLKKNK